MFVYFLLDSQDYIHLFLFRRGVFLHRGREPGGAVLPLLLRGPGGLLQGDTQEDLAQLPGTGQYISTVILLSKVLTKRKHFYTISPTTV